MTWWGKLSGRYRVAANPLRTERHIELVAVVLALMLSLQLVYSGVGLLLAPAVDAVPPAVDVLQIKQVHGPALVASGESDEIRSRPLFWRSRQPLEAGSGDAVTAQEAGAETGQLKEVKLLGVFGSGDTAGIIALVKGEKRRILQGESVLGWKLDAVEPNRIVLLDGEQRKELVLKAGTVVATAVPAGSPQGGAAMVSPAAGAGGKPPAAGSAQGNPAPIEVKAESPVSLDERKLRMRRNSASAAEKK